ncbi:MAG: hypothetical protein J5J06_09525 [Phycisphaerae bacterium]|nr:hypothetical protein [Phycisphaerae bacterium]
MPDHGINAIVAAGYVPVPSGDPAARLIADRRQTANLALDDVITELRSRYEVWRQNTAEIVASRLHVCNQLHHWEAYFGPPREELRASVQTLLLRLDRQKRDERISRWRDASRLRQALPESIRQYFSAHRLIVIRHGNAPRAR